MPSRLTPESVAVSGRRAAGAACQSQPRQQNPVISTSDAAEPGMPKGFRGSAAASVAITDTRVSSTMTPLTGTGGALC